jgi:radical SAM protein with 4Fe4S-binding SPASM domain
MAEATGTMRMNTPENVVFEVTSLCNNDCIYCYNVWKSPLHRYPKGQMSLSEVIHVIDNLLDDLPVKTVALSGGEPFLRDDLSQIVSYLWSHRVNSVIITNGTLLTRENIARTCGVNNYELPLLSYRRNVHNHLTRRDCFDKVIQGMHDVKEEGGRFVVAFIATQINYADLEKTVELAIALGAEGILYNRMNVSAHNYPLMKTLLPSPDMIKENLDVLEAFGESYGLHVASSIPIQPCLIDMSHYKYIHPGFCPLAGENDRKNAYFTIDPLGNLRACNHSSYILGNVLEEKITDLMDHPYVEKFRKILPEDCISCPTPVREYCHGGCKAAAEECFGSLDVSEPFLNCYSHQRTIPSI